MHHQDRKHRVLLVEDNQLVQRAIALLLRRDDCHVDAVLDTEKTPYDIGIFDLELGGTDGVAVATDLLARRLVRHVLFFTGSADQEALARAKALGTVVSKGNTDDLRRAVADLTARTAGNLL